MRGARTAGRGPLARADGGRGERRDGPAYGGCAHRPPVAILFCSLTAIALALGGAPSARLHRLHASACRLCLLVGGTELGVRGAGWIEAQRACVVVADHESGWDPLGLLAGLPQLVMRFVVQREFMDIPILGQALRLAGNVRVLRTHTPSDAAQIRAAMDRRDPKVSIPSFAEGRRLRRTGIDRGESTESAPAARSIR